MICLLFFLVYYAAADMIFFNGTIRSSTDSLANVTDAICVSGDRVAAPSIRSGAR